MHLDDEVHRILARMGVGTEFAAISRPAKGLRLLDADSRVLAEFARSETAGIHGFPQASMFDQPELERLLRANLARHPSARLRGSVEVTGIVRQAIAGDGRVTVELTDLATGESGAVDADYVLGCDGANGVVRDAIGARMAELGFEQRWLVVDVATDADLGQWDGVHQVCSPRRAATYMRIGADRYRFEFQLLGDESAADFTRFRPCTRCCDRGSAPTRPVRISSSSGWPSTRSGRGSRSGGATGRSSCSATPHTSPRPSSARGWARVCATRPTWPGR